jgi:hypothetical protein
MFSLSFSVREYAFSSLMGNVCSNASNTSLNIISIDIWGAYDESISMRKRNINGL